MSHVPSGIHILGSQPLGASKPWTAAHDIATKRLERWNGRCWNYAPSVCSKYGQRYANVPAYREQRLLVLKKKRWVCPEKENIGPSILCPQNQKTYSPPYKSRPNYQSLKKSLGTNNPETRRMYDYIRVLEKRGMWLATLWWCALMRPIEWRILCWVMRFKGIIGENPEIWRKSPPIFGYNHHP